MSHTANPMHKAHNAPRCAAKSKRSGCRCKAPAVKGWTVCRMHGAGGGATSGPENSRWLHGMRSKEWTEARAEINELVREARDIEQMLRSSAE